MCWISDEYLLGTCWGRAEYVINEWWQYSCYIPFDHIFPSPFSSTLSPSSPHSVSFAPLIPSTGCVRLRGQLSQECLQYHDSLHTISIHFCRHRRSIIQRKVLLLHWQIQAKRRRMSWTIFCVQGKRKKKYRRHITVTFIMAIDSLIAIIILRRCITVWYNDFDYIIMRPEKVYM